jgi:outer membrane protein
MITGQNKLISLLRFFAISCLVFASGEIYGQKVWTLKECVDYAIANNLSVKQQTINNDINKINVDQSRWSFAPTLDGSGSTSYNWGRTVDPFAYTFTNQELRSTNLSLNGGITLFNGFRLQNILDQSKLNYLASQSDLKKIQNDISLNVISEYLQILYAKEQIGIMKVRIEESKKQLQRTTLLVDAGTLTRGNQLDAETQVANEELSLVNAENQLAAAKLNLTQLLELRDAKDFDVEKPATDLPYEQILSQTPEQIYELSIKHLPEITSAEYNLQSSEKEIAISRSQLLPRLAMFGNISTGYSSATQNALGAPIDLGYQPTGAITQSNEQVLAPVYFQDFEDTPFSDQINNNVNKNVGISLAIPIFSGFSARSNVSRSKLNYLNAEVTAQQTKNTVYKSIQQAYNDAVSSQKKYIATTKSVESLKEAYLYADKKYAAGISNSLELLVASNSLTRAQSEQLQAKYDFIFKVKILDFYAGNPLVY